MSGSDERPRGSFFDVLRQITVSTDSASSVPRGLRVATAYAWRFAVIALAIGIAIWIVVIGALRVMAKTDPMMRQVYVRHVGYRQTYRPTSTPWRRY